MTPRRAGLFRLAEHLHMTVYQLTHALPLDEYIEWCQYLAEQNKPAEPSAINLADATQEQLKRMFPG